MLEYQLEIISSLKNLLGTTRDKSCVKINEKKIIQIENNMKTQSKLIDYERHYIQLRRLADGMAIREIEEPFMNAHITNINSLIDFILYCQYKMLTISDESGKGALYGLIIHHCSVVRMKDFPYYAYFLDDYVCEIVSTPCNVVNNWLYPSQNTICQLILYNKFKYIIATADDIFANRKTMLWCNSFIFGNKIVSTVEDLQIEVEFGRSCIAFLTPYEALQYLSTQKARNLSDTCVFFQYCKNSKTDFSSTINALKYGNQRKKLQYVIGTSQMSEIDNDIDRVYAPQCIKNIK